MRFPLQSRLKAFCGSISITCSPTEVFGFVNSQRSTMDLVEERMKLKRVDTSWPQELAFAVHLVLYHLLGRHLSSLSIFYGVAMFVSVAFGTTD